MVKTNFKSFARIGSAAVFGVVLGLVTMIPMSALAEVPRKAFKEVCASDAMRAITGNAKIEDGAGKIEIDAPAIAENGGEVKVSVIPKLKNVQQVTLFAESNPTPLIASYKMPEGVTMQVGTRVKLLGSQNVIALVKAGGKYYKVARQVKVTIGGCGGGSAKPVTASKPKRCK